MILEKDKETQSKYYLSYPKPPFLDMKWGVSLVGKVPSSAKWRLGKNAVLRLIECLRPRVTFDVFVDNYFISFVLLTLFGVNNIRATRVTVMTGGG